MDGKLLLSFSLDSAPSSRRVGMGCRGLPRLPGVTGGVGRGLGNVEGEWLLCRRGEGGERREERRREEEERERKRF